VEETLFKAPVASIEAAELALPTLEDLDVRLISPTEWRVSDSRLSDDDARSVLGFVEKSDERFNAMRMTHGHGVTWSTFCTMEDALASFTQAVTAVAAA